MQTLAQRQPVGRAQRAVSVTMTAGPNDIDPCDGRCSVCLDFMISYHTKALADDEHRTAPVGDDVPAGSLFFLSSLKAVGGLC